ncbi:hypothetical protein M430DRAFT_232171 [Amorphotheca resinae ATCC 22711]|uniref:Uncharacterized protein n=1 Tax=Amorphotheca resinae ATCC 22711 TaxID=857342 RepID=A0A2T3B3U8_AMORE|nr:hypothetical protein M430DRAFT_232171 [Amorphotheca resinae ATCC 22711]PSS20310.1 hypothetical protein M430DRAFT_232171 [Amorphotheca resinae ATCC 22711]
MSLCKYFMYLPPLYTRCTTAQLHNYRTRAIHDQSALPRLPPTRSSIHGIDSIPSTIHTSLKSAMPWAPKADPSALPIRPSALYLRTPLLPLHHSQLLSAHFQPTAASIRPPRYMSLSTRQWSPLSYLPTISLLSLRPACLGWRRIHPALSVCCASSARRVIGCQDWTSWDECGESAREGEVGAGA